MKSLFKRTLAMASSSVLALTQLAAVAGTVNISAADVAETAASSSLNVDKAFVLYVPVDAADPLKAASSNWNDKVESALMSYGDQHREVYAARLREKVKPYLTKRGYLNSVEVAEILDQIGLAKVDVKTDGTAVATISLGEIAPILTKAAERNVGKYVDLDFDDPAHPITPDWTGYSIKGKIIVNAETDFSAKTVSYKVTVIDDQGKALETAEDFQNYVSAKGDAAADIILAAAMKAGYDEEKLAKAEQKLKSIDKRVAQADELAAAIYGISASSSDLNEVYKSVVEQAEQIVKDANVRQSYEDKIFDLEDEYKPESVESVFENEKVQEAYSKAVEEFNEHFSDFATISLTLDDVKSVIDDAITSTYTVPNGYSFDAEVTIVDDQADEILAALLATGQTAKQVSEAGYTVVLDQKDGTVVTDFDEKEYEIIGVYSEKKITGKIDTQFALAGTAFFDVERTVKQVIVKEKETTTTTVTSTTPADETTTTTITSTTPSNETSTTPVTSTTPADQTTTTTTTTEPTETTIAPEELFKIEGIENKGLVYWSEETSSIDLSSLSVSVRIFEDGVATDKTVDITNAFTATANKVSDLNMPEGIGIAATPIVLKLTNIEAANKALALAGLDAEKAGLVEGMEAGKFTVYLVHRGDADLNGTITVEDAQYALLYYVETLVNQKDAKSAFDNTAYLNNKGDKKEKYFPFSHYAADAYDGNGYITAEDAQMILLYYTEVVVNYNENTQWTDEAVGALDQNPLDILHAEPFAKDDYAAAYRSEGFDPELAENK